jgi:hypothetical protein
MSKKSFSNYALDFALPLALAAREATDDQGWTTDWIAAQTRDLGLGVQVSVG